MKVLSPVGERRAVEVKAEKVSLLPTLKEKIVGIVDNGIGKSYWARVEELLKDKAKVTDIIRRKKIHMNQPSPLEIIDEIASKCDAVIVGVGL